MTQNRLLVAIAFLLMSLGPKAFAQDPAFTQFYANPMYLNPAMAGSANCPRVSMNYRNQWPNLKGAFVTSGISIDQNIENIHGGLGLMVINDNQGEGALTSTRASAIYSYQLQVTKKLTVLTGFETSYHQRYLDKSKLVFGDQIDPYAGIVYETEEQLDKIAPNISFVDFSMGFMAFTKQYFFGYALHHLTEPEQAFITEAKLPMSMTIHAGANIPVGQGRSMGLVMDGPFITPNFMYQSQAGAEQINIGASLTNESISGGVYYRSNMNNSDAILLVVGYQKDAYRFGYSYDYTVSELSGLSGGAHELSLTIQLACRDKKKKLKAIKCPKF